MYDLIIIGSGPAGLSAAVYAKRAGLNTLVLEKSSMSGGQVLTTYEVDNYLGLPGINGFDMGMKFREHADKMGVEFAEAEVLGVETAEVAPEMKPAKAAEMTAEMTEENKGAAINANAEACRQETHAAEITATDEQLDGRKENAERIHHVMTDRGSYDARAILLATGANHSKLGVPGEEELAGMGVSYCATCDGAFFRNRTVAVVGGGDVAAEDAIFLARTSKKVYLIHRRDELRAAKILQEKLNSLPNVEILWNTVVDEIQGKEQVENLQIRNVKSKETKTLAVDGVFIAVGIHPNAGTFEDIVECDAKGYIIAGEDGITKTPGIFAAGDVRTKSLRQIITAVSDGANAVASIQNYFITK